MQFNPSLDQVAESRRLIFWITPFALVLILAIAGCSNSTVGGKGAEQRAENSAGGSVTGDNVADSSNSTVQTPSFDPSKPLVVSRGNTERKMVTITLDDGWNHDDRILSLLQSQDVPATAFLIGGRGVAESQPAWVKQLDDMGMEICSHTYSHYKLTDHPVEWISADIKKGLDVIATETGKRLPYMRPPGGFLNDAVKQAAIENQCYVIMWTSSLGDTTPGITVEQQVQGVLSSLCNGDIILCHFGGYNTYEALSRLIPEIRQRGYDFGTLTEVLAP